MHMIYDYSLSFCIFFLVFLKREKKTSNDYFLLKKFFFVLFSLNTISCLQTLRRTRVLSFSPFYVLFLSLCYYYLYYLCYHLYSLLLIFFIESNQLIFYHIYLSYFLHFDSSFSFYFLLPSHFFLSIRTKVKVATASYMGENTKR